MRQNKRTFIYISAMICFLAGCAKPTEIELTDVYPSKESFSDWLETGEGSSIVTESESDLAQSENFTWQFVIQGKTVSGTEEDVTVDGERIYCSSNLLEDVLLAEEGFYPTSYIDSNGLHCVGHRYRFGEDGTPHTLEKAYILSDDTFVSFAEVWSDSELFDQSGQMLNLEKLLRELSWEYQIDKENQKIWVNDVFQKKIVYEPLVPQMKSNSIWLTNGKRSVADLALGDDYKNKFSSTKEECPISVTEGEKLILDYYFSWFSEVAGILFLDDRGQVIAYQSSEQSFLVRDKEVVVPKNATSMHLTYYGNQTYDIKREKTLWVPVKQQVEKNQERLSKMEQTATESYVNARTEMDKAYITFVLDDCRPDMDKVANIFAEYEMPLCIAGIWELMNYSASEGNLTRAEVCQMVVTNGGEILAHDGEVLTEQYLTEIQKLEKHFVTDKYILEQFGFDINGIILAGGEGLVEGDEVTDLWSRNFYQYSDLYGAEAKGEPYYRRRYWLGQAKDEYEELISAAINRQKWLVLYFHDLKEVDAESLRAILSYIDSQGEKIEVVTYETMYEAIYGLEIH